MSPHATNEHGSIEDALRRASVPPTPAEPAGSVRERSATQAGDAARRVAARVAAEGLADVSYASAHSPFGTLLLATTGRGLVRVAFPGRTSTPCWNASRGESRRGSSRRRRRWSRRGGSSSVLRRGPPRVQAGLAGPRGPLRAPRPSGDLRDPLWRRAELWRGRRRRGLPARLTCRRERPRREPDPDRDPVPSRPACRRRSRRLRRRG